MAGARLRKLDIPWAGFHQATAIRARAEENISQMISRAITGAGRDIGAGIAAGKRRRQQQAQFDESMDLRREQFEHRQDMDAKAYGLREQAMRMDRADHAMNMALKNVESLKLQQAAVGNELQMLYQGGVPIDDPRFGDALQRFNDLNSQVYDAAGNVGAYATRSGDLTKSLNSAVSAQVDPDCPPGGT